MNTHYIVQTASASMPASVKSPYGRVGVLEVEAGLNRVSMISERARGCVQVVATWERCFVGKTSRSAFGRALWLAHKLADQLNDEAEIAEIIRLETIEAEVAA